MASNNPMDYIHPIIQAYISSQQLQQRQREFLASQEQAQQLRDQRAKEFDAELKISQQNADRLDKAQTLQRNAAVAAEAHRIRTEIATGIRKPQSVNAGNGPLNTELPFYIDENNALGPVVAEDIATPRDLALQKEQELRGLIPVNAANAGAVMGAQVAARKPELDAREAGLLKRTNAQGVARILQEMERHKNRMEEIKLQNDGKVAAKQAGDKNDAFLSVNDALSLGVPYGTTKKEAVGLEVNKPLPEGTQMKLTNLESLKGLIDQAITLGDQTKWGAQGSMYMGTLKSLFDNVAGNPDKTVESYRDILGNLSGSIALERGGTSFTTNEKALLNTYNVNLNDNPVRARIKLIELQKFIGNKIKGIQTPSFRRRTPEGEVPEPSAPQNGNGRVQVGRDPVTGALK